MNMKAKDFGLILSLAFIIAIGAYWLLRDLSNQNFDQYLSLLGDKLLTMIPESSEKRTIENMFTDFKQDVEKKDITPEQVEQVAAGIMNITNISDTVSVEEARAILNFSSEIPDSITLPPESIPSKKPIDEKRWKEMQKRIESVYLFNEKLKDRSREIVKEPYLLYSVGDELQIIIDKKIKSDSLMKSDSLLVKELEQLEEEKLIIWQDNFEKKLQEKIKEEERKLKIANKKALNLARIKILENLQIIKSIDGLDSLLIEADMHLDSLEIPSVDIKINP